MSLVVHWGPGDQANGNSHAVQQEQELLKNFLDCDGRSQFTYKSVASPYVKQITHTLKWQQPVNCSTLHFFLLGINKAHLEQCI